MKKVQSLLTAILLTTIAAGHASAQDWSSGNAGGSWLVPPGYSPPREQPLTPRFSDPYGNLYGSMSLPRNFYNPPPEAPRYVPIPPQYMPR